MKITKLFVLVFLLSFSILCAQEKQPFPKGGMESILQNVVYPKAAKEAKIQGKVIVKAIIDEKGSVTKTEIMQSVNSDLDSAATNAIKLTKFTPAEKDGKPVKAEIIVPIMFKLE